MAPLMLMKYTFLYDKMMLIQVHCLSGATTPKPSFAQCCTGLAKEGSCQGRWNNQQ